MDATGQQSGVDVTLGQLGANDHAGWLTDLSSGELRWCVLIDLVFCVFPSDDENERPMKTLLLPGLHVKRLLFMSAHPGSVYVGTTTRHHSPNGTTISGMPRHQFVISQPGSGRVDMFGSPLLRDVTEWIWKLELAVAQQTDVTSQTNSGVGFRNDRCMLQTDLSDYVPSACTTRLDRVDGRNKESVHYLTNPVGGGDGKQRKWHHRLLRHTESSPPKCKGRRLVRTSSCPTEKLWCEHPRAGNHTNNEKAHSNLRRAYSSVAPTNGTRLEGICCSLDDVSEADCHSPNRKNGLRRALSLSGVISTKTQRNGTLSRMKQFILGFKIKRRRTVSHTTLVESSLEDHKEAWPLDDLLDDPKTALLHSAPADCTTKDLISDVGRSGMKNAFSETALNCDGKRRPRQRRGCRRAATVTSRMYEHRTEPKTVSFVKHDATRETVGDATRQTTVTNIHKCSDAKQEVLLDVVSPTPAPRRNVKRRRGGLFRKGFFGSVVGFLRCASTRHKDFGVTNCIGSRATPWATEDKATTDDINAEHLIVSQKSNQSKKLSPRRWDHPPLIGNFRRRSKPLTQLDNDDRGYMDDLPLIQGYIYWLQSSAEWQRRWCVLKANVLYRLATPSSDDVIDNFKLDVWAVKRWDSGTLHGRPFCCELIYDEFCSEFFSTDSEGELLIWLNRLERVTDGPAETTSAGLARRKTVTGSTQSLHATVRRAHSADSPYVQQQQQLERDRLWLQKQQLLEEVLRQKAALERQQRKTILARNYEKQPRPDTPSDASSNYDIGADTDILWHLRMRKTATKLKINDLERHLEACQEKSQYEMFNRDRPTTETSLIDEIDAVMTTDDLYRRLAELKLELTETERDLKEFHYKALRSGESMFLSQGNLRSYGVSKTLGCGCVYSKCDTKHEVRCGQGRICAKSCTNLARENTHISTIDARIPHENSVQHTARQQLTRTRPTSSGLPPRRAYSLHDTNVPKPTPCTAGPSVSSGINRKPSFPLAKAPVRRHDSDSAYIVTKNNRYPLFCSGPKGDAQICQSPQEQQLMTSNPVTRTGLRPRIQGHAPLRRLADTPGLGSINHDNHHIINDQDEKQTQNADERAYCTKGVGRYRRQNSDTRNDTITTYDSGVGTLSDSQDNRVEGQVRHRRVMVEAPQTSWLRRRSASITGHLGVLPSKLKAFMPGKTQANDKRRWTSCDSPPLSNPPATRVGGVDIEALSRKYKLGKATERYRAAGENQNIVQRGDFRRQDAVKETIVLKSNSGDCFEAAMLRGDVTRQRRAVPPGESGGHDCDVRRCCATSNGVNGLQRSTNGSVVKNNTSETRPIRRHNTVNCADFSSSANKDTPHRRVTRNVVTPWRTEVNTKSRASVCHQCGTVVSRDAERAPRSRCCTTAKDAETPEISAEALAHIAAFEKLIDDQFGLMSAARL